MCYVGKRVWSDAHCRKATVGSQADVFVLFAFLPEELDSLLSDYDILPQASLRQHSVRKRDLQAPTHLETLLTFSALKR